MLRILEAVLTYTLALTLGVFGCLLVIEFMELRERVEALEQEGTQQFEIMILPGEPGWEPPPPPPGVRICPATQRKSC
jgi:hypothetical protein